MGNRHDIKLNQAPIRWALDEGRMSFFDIPAVTFWLNPSLLRILQPLREEVGDELYRLIIAYQASLGTEEDYQQMVSQLGNSFEEGFLAWGAAVSAAGWGHFEILALSQTDKTAIVRVSNPWELQMLESQPDADAWGCPFLMGKIIGIFSHALGESCWADEKNIILKEGSSAVEFHIYASDLTIADELEKLRSVRRKAREAQLVEEIRQHQQAETSLRNLAANFASVSGEEFFAKVSSHLASTLALDYVFIAELVTGKDRANAVGGYAKGAALTLPFAYDLKDTPCENVVKQKFCFHPSDVQAQFPKDTLLNEMGVDSYIGIPLYGKDGNVLGLIAGLDSKPLRSPDLAESLFKVFSSRIAVEIERKQAEEKLKKSEIQYRSLFESSTDAILVLDEDGFIECNPSALKMFGWASLADIGGHPSDFSPPVQPCGTDSRVLADEHIATAFNNGNHQFEWLHKRMDGSEFPAEVRLSAMQLDGKPALQATVHDISARKQAEEAQRNSETNYQRLVEFSPEPICVHSEGKFVYINTEGVRRLGASGWKEIVGRDVLDFVHPDDRDLVQERLRMQADSKQASPLIEEKLIRLDGGVIHAEVTGMPVVYQGKPATMVLFRDITRRKQSEHALRKLSAAVEQAGESIIITDKGGVIEYVNPAFVNITGYSAEEAIGQTPRILKSGNQDGHFYAAMWKRISSGRVWQGKVIDKKKDGSFFPAMLTISPIMDDHNDITHYVGLHADLTEQESLEQQFQQAQKMEAIGTLVGGIAHDFNNILAGMTGNLYLAKKHVENDPVMLQKLDNVEQLSMRAANMIEQLLTFARKGIIRMKTMPLPPFIKETLKFLRTSTPENIAMHEYICSDDLLVKGDATQLHQILMNLISNACDALEGVDEPCITIRLETYHPDKAFTQAHPDATTASYARLSVEDNGCGIPGHLHTHLFEPFFTTKEQGKGTGLGLAMVYGAVTSHHGFVEIDSAPNKGATFQIYLPLLEQQQAAPRTTIGKAEAIEGHGELILLADDERCVRETTAEVLKILGYEVLQAEDGLKALELCKDRKNDINLAMLDVVMPHCGGMQLAGKIREIQPDMPVIFMTGYDKEHVLGGDEPMPNSEILTKPVHFDALSHCIRQFLDNT